MPDAFEDIRILSLVEDLSGPTGHGASQEMVFRLSDYPPAAWTEHFNALWRGRIVYKRDVEILGNTIVVYGKKIDTPDEYLTSLNEVFSRANSDYRDHLESPPDDDDFGWR